MLDFFKKLIHAIRPPKRDSLNESHLFWRGAFYGLMALSLFITFLGGYFFRTGLSPYLMAGATVSIGFIGFWVLRFLAGLSHTLINNLLYKIPTFIFSLIIGTIAMFSLAKELRFGWPSNVMTNSIIISMISFGVFGGSLWVLIKSQKLLL